MKSRYSIISFIFAILTMILAISSLMGNFNINVIIYMLICMSFFQLFNGLYYFEQDKKRDGILWILSSIVCLGAVISAVINIVLL